MTDKIEAKKARVIRHVQFVNDNWTDHRAEARSILWIIQGAIRRPDGEALIPSVGGLNVEALKELFDE